SQSRTIRLGHTQRQTQRRQERDELGAVVAGVEDGDDVVNRHDDTVASRSALRASTHAANSSMSQPTVRGPSLIGFGARPAFCRSYQVLVGTPVSWKRCGSRATPLGSLLAPTEPWLCIGPSRFHSDGRILNFFQLSDLPVIGGISG